MANDILGKSGAVVKGHFVYKALTHGDLYINKEVMTAMSAKDTQDIILDACINAIDSGFYEVVLEHEHEEIGVIGPAFGAIPYSMAAAMVFEMTFGFSTQGIKFFAARTEIDVDSKTGKRFHILPEKLKNIYRGKSFIIFEDIVNNGKSVEEVVELFKRELDAEVFAVICLVDRGDAREKIKEKAGIEYFYPLIQVEMKQYKSHECELCKQGVPINLNLGKGKEWVRQHGQPPYK